MTREEDILHALRKLEAMSRRKPAEAFPPPPPHHPDAPPPMGMPPRNQGRGRMLGVLSDNGAMSQTQLAALLDIRPQSLSELLAKSEAEGFIERRQSDEDKRQTIVSITDAGRSRVALFRDEHRKRAEEFCSPLTEDEKNTLLALLTKLIDVKDGAENDRKNQEA